MSKKLLINIKAVDKKNSYPKQREMLEINLRKAVEVFFEIEDKKDILFNKMLPEYNTKFKGMYKKPFQPDIVVKAHKLIFEYDGFMHYQHPFHIERDNIKEKMIKELGYERIRWPYFYQLTKETAKFIFGTLVTHFRGEQLKDVYTEEKFYKVLNQIYVNPKTHQPLTQKDYENGLLFAPGFHGTEHLPSSFNRKGIERFLKDFKWECKKENCSCKGKIPKEVILPVIKSIQLYENDIENNEQKDRSHIVLSEDKEFANFYNEMKNELKNYHCNFYYPRERKIEVDAKVLEKMKSNKKTVKKQN